MAKTKISIVQYLNAVPLVWSILEGPHKDQFDAVFSTPAECAQQLASGQVDVGLIPSIEYQRIPGTRIIPGPSIASRRRALTVLLLSLFPLARVRSVAYDPASRSSVALAQILFYEFYRRKPDFRSSESKLATMLTANDAALIIGDAALRYKADHMLPSAESQKELLRDGAEPLQVFDLMERWSNLTGLPFVFAFWAVRPGFTDRGLVGRLHEIRQYGLERLGEIADRYAGTMELSRELLLQYLSQHMDYHMDSDGIEALRQFYSKAARVGAIERVRPIEFL